MPSAAPDAGPKYDPTAGHRRLAEAKQTEHERELARHAREATFDSLRPKAKLDPDQEEKATRLLAEAAVRRLQRWCNPDTGGLDPDDHDGLLRQGTAYGLSAEVTEQVLAGVETAWRLRPVPASPTAVALSAKRRRRWVLPAVLTLLVVLLGASQLLMLLLWRGLLDA